MMLDDVVEGSSLTEEMTPMPKKTTQADIYARRKVSGKIACNFWLEPEELEKLRAISERRGTSLRAAVVYAISFGYAALPSETGWTCEACGTVNTAKALECEICKRKVDQSPR